MRSGVVRGIRERGLPLALFFVVYAGAARVGLSFDPLGGVASTVWPPTGIAICALFRFGAWMWPAVALGAFLTNLHAGVGAAAAAIMATGNSLEAVTGALLLRRYGFHAALDRLRDVLVLFVPVALLSTALSATGGALGLRVAGARAGRDLAEVWSVWWLGDIMGVLLVAPLLFSWGATERVALRRPGETAALAVVLAAATMLVFGGFVPPAMTELLRQSHVIFPLLLWAALRFGPRGASTAMTIVATTAIAFTVAGRGPFVYGSRHESLLFLQSHLMVEAATALALAAAIMERRNAVRARDDFISVASHELKTPIAALRLRLDMLARLQRDRGLTEPLRGTLGERVRRATRQLDRLTGLVDDMLDVSRLGAGRLVLQRGPVDLAELARDVVERLREELAAARCAVELQVEAPLAGRWDRSRLEQVLTNLLTNATKYAPGAPVTVSVRRDGDLAVLVVRDAGPGVPREQQRRIFEPYERGPATRGVAGLGLGLFIVSEIVRAHGGALALDSAPGRGAAFSVRLPLADPDPLSSGTGTGQG